MQHLQKTRGVALLWLTRHPMKGAFDKNEGVVKAQNRAAVFLPPRDCRVVEDRSSETLTVNHFAVESFHQPSIRSPTAAMILLSESRFSPGRERPINPAV